MSKDKKSANTEEVNPKKEAISFIIYCVVVVAIVAFILGFVGQRTQVHGTSMYDTLDDGDNLIVEKWTYHFHGPERYDIVVFERTLDGKTEKLIKRVIGMPGETVWISEDGLVYINGEVSDENFGYEPIDLMRRYSAAEPIVLGEGEYFVLGDNRNNSRDSRDPAVGVVTEDEFEGRAVVRIYPFNKFGIITPIVSNDL